VTDKSRIINADKEIMVRCAENIVRLNNGRLTMMEDGRVKVVCSKLGLRATLKVQNGRLLVSYDSDLGREHVMGIIEQYYIPTLFCSEEIFNAEMMLDENGEIDVSMEVPEEMLLELMA